VYLPKVFQEDRLDVMQEVIRGAGLATVVTLTDEGLIASHVPLVLDPEPAPYGTLIGHVARPNPQGTRSLPEVQALAIFQGPNAYVTPNWYPTKHETGKAVPTWNYVAVHAYGPIRFFDDPDRLLDAVTRLTERHEQVRPAPWAVADAPADYVAGMLRGIIGFEMPIARLEGKWKMNQNRLPADRAGVIAGLTEEGREDVAQLIAPPG
jgi:transcriptional regulator